MNAALIIRAEPIAQNSGLTEMMDCMVSLTVLAVQSGKEVSVVMQHNIKNDHFVVLAEVGYRSFGHHGKSFREVFKKLKREVDHYLKGSHEELRTTKKQAAREEGSKRRRWPSSERQRLKSVRKGRLPKRRQRQG